MLSLIDAEGFRKIAKLDDVDFVAALLSGQLPAAIGLVNGIPHWSQDQANDFFLQGFSKSSEQTAAARAVLNESNKEKQNGSQPSQAPVIDDHHDDAERFGEAMAADFIGLAPEALKLAREGGSGPVHTRDATGKIVYRVGDLRAFQAERARIETKPASAFPLMKVAEAAAYCGYTVSSLNTFRHRGGGPNWSIGRSDSAHHVRIALYAREDLDAWMQHHTKGAYDRKPAEKTKDARVKRKRKPSSEYTAEEMEQQRARAAHARKCLAESRVRKAQQAERDALAQQVAEAAHRNAGERVHTALARGKTTVAAAIASQRH